MTHEASVTHTQYVSISKAFDLLNQTLFEGKLPTILITLQRHANSRGYYSQGMFTNRDANPDAQDAATDEIALNPDAFRGRTDEEIFSTLAHEMCHLWEACEGKAPKSAYHTKAWADKMESIGLMPSDTGMPGGKRTGAKMTHFVVSGGAFQRAYAAIAAAGIKLQWESAPETPQAKKKTASKTKFTCAACGANAWGKPTLKVACMPCDLPMLAEDGTGEEQD